MSFMEKLFGNFSDKELKRIKPIANKVLELEPEMQKLTDEELQAKTPYLKEKLKNGASLDDILPEAFAVCREADWRVLGLKPYPVQIIGGIVLHRSCIAEMQTGEGKTLVATMPVYLNALTGEGVHVVTVNDYLAKRDSEWMGKVYRFLGLTVGLVIHDVQPQDRRKAYLADVTYGTNNEFGFDYLRDNMVVYKASMVQRGHAYAIVDEVDSILIDEARTPLIISGKGEDSSVMYKRADDFAKTLKKSVIVELDDKVEADEQVDGDYVVDEKHKTCTLTESGVKKAEAWFNVENLADADNMTLRHYIDGAIKARGVMHRDTDYIVKDGEVIIVDEFTGRLMYGRRFNDGLHQAIEAKEGVTVAAESKTLASITFQNYFRMYKKLGGMTGTASTEADEFSEIYGLQIVSIPTNKPRARKDLPDSVYKTINGKYNAVIEQVAECHAKGQPVLVGTVSVEKSEALSKLLKKRGIEFVVASGNQYYQLISFFPELKDEISFVAENGALVYEHGKQLFHGELTRHESRIVIGELLKDKQLNFVACGLQSAYVSENAPEAFVALMAKHYHRLKPVKDYQEIDDVLFKFSLNLPDEQIPLVIDKLHVALDGIMKPVTSGFGFIDLIIPGLHKANGISRLLKRWDLSPQNVVAIGDSGNDAEMLKMARYSFAMGNAAENIKQIARYATDDNNHEGALNVIQAVLDNTSPFNS